MASRALGVLLAVAALLAASATTAADDDDKTKPWTCFRSCAKGCHHHKNVSATVATTDFPSAVSAGCKSGCQADACFKDLPAISHTQCAMATCLSHPHHIKKKTACLKDCCDKCFRKSPPAPGPPKPGPPKPGPPKPGPPKPGPPPPEPGPPEPGPPTPGPGPEPPSPPN